jgi:hypothetical protein
MDRIYDTDCENQKWKHFSLGNQKEKWSPAGPNLRCKNNIEIHGPLEKRWSVKAWTELNLFRMSLNFGFFVTSVVNITFNNINENKLI